jgi:hypothetical protein
MSIICHAPRLGAEELDGIPKPDRRRRHGEAAHRGGEVRQAALVHSEEIPAFERRCHGYQAQPVFELSEQHP